MNRHMNRERLNIGVYHLAPYARTEQHIRELAECGIDFVICLNDDRPTLDLFEKYGIGAIVTGITPSWWGDFGENASTFAAVNPIGKYEEIAGGFTDHPAIWGLDIGDEPSALDFPHFGKVLNYVNKHFPNQFAYLNLYPNYATGAQHTSVQPYCQLGTETYTQYIEKYCEYIPADYICYDYYAYLYAAGVSGHYENLRVVADACLKTGRSLWIVLQVNSYDPEVWISENQLRFQAYSAMAFGAENITWACYTAGWWNNQVLDSEGNKTQQYEKLKKINAEIRTFGEEYMKYRRTATHFVGFEGSPYLEKLENTQPVAELNTGAFQGVHAENGESLLIGQMVSRNNDGSTALFICGADDPLDENNKTYTIVFRADGMEVSAFGPNGPVPVTQATDGSCSLEISSCSAVLITAK